MTNIFYFMKKVFGIVGYSSYSSAENMLTIYKTHDNIKYYHPYSRSTSANICLHCNKWHSFVNFLVADKFGKYWTMWVLSIMKIDLLNRRTSRFLIAAYLCVNRDQRWKSLFNLNTPLNTNLIFEFSVAKVILVVFKIQVSRIDWEDWHRESKF